jgi:hypothetical protein
VSLLANFLLFYCNFTVTFAFVYGLKNRGRVRAPPPPPPRHYGEQRKVNALIPLFAATLPPSNY